MNASKEDFDSLGLTSDEWKALVLGRGVVPPHKLQSARAALAQLGGFQGPAHRNPDMADRGLVILATLHPRFWLSKDERLSREDNIKFLQAKNLWSREQAEEHLAQVVEDRAIWDAISGGTPDA